MRPVTITTHPGKERGAALLVSLIVLLVLTLLAVSSMQGSLMQERMTSAQRDGMIALDSAEGAIPSIETTLASFNTTNYGTVNGFYDIGNAVPDPFADATWDPTGTASVAAPTVNGITPRYFVEYRGPIVLNAEEELPRNLANGGVTTPVAAEVARVVIMAPGPSGIGRRILEGFIVYPLPP